MGVYDEIKAPEAECPRCGGTVGSDDRAWQSKDGPCDWLFTNERVPFAEVDNFYASCRECKLWLEFRYRTKPPEERTLDDYELICTEWQDGKSERLDPGALRKRRAEGKDQSPSKEALP